MHYSQSDTQQFIREYRDAFVRAQSLLEERGAGGRDEFMPIQGKFCFGLTSVMSFIWSKTCRAVGHLSTGNKQKAYEEVEDILNYCAIFMALYRMETYNESNLDTPGSRIGDLYRNGTDAFSSGPLDGSNESESKIRSCVARQYTAE